MSWSLIFRAFTWISTILSGILPLWDLWDKVKPKEKERRYFFTAMDRYIDYMIPNFKNPSYKKQCAIKIFLYIKYKVMKDWGKSIWLMKKKPKDIVVSFYDAVRKYENEAIKAGVPSCFVQKFSEKHIVLVKAIESQLIDLTKNENPSIRELKKQTLRFLLGAFVATTENLLAGTLDNINGQFEKELKAFDPSTHRLYHKLQLWRT